MPCENCKCKQCRPPKCRCGGTLHALKSIPPSSRCSRCKEIVVEKPYDTKRGWING